VILLRAIASPNPYPFPNCGDWILTKGSNMLDNLCTSTPGPWLDHRVSGLYPAT